jgi:PadR family transcriptional regulator, regulatory protein PadR
MARKVEQDFFGGSIRLHILHHAASGKVFGQGLMDELQHHGYRLSPGTLYPILHALERGGYLRSTPKQVAGKRRRVYVATSAGKNALTASRQRVMALFQEILGDQGGSPSSYRSIRRRGKPQPPESLTPGTNSASNVARARTTRITPNPKQGK